MSDDPLRDKRQDEAFRARLSKRMEEDRELLRRIADDGPKVPDLTQTCPMCHGTGKIR